MTDVLFFVGTGVALPSELELPLQVLETCRAEVGGQTLSWSWNSTGSISLFLGNTLSSVSMYCSFSLKIFLPPLIHFIYFILIKIILVCTNDSNLFIISLFSKQYKHTNQKFSCVNLTLQKGIF